MKSLLGHSFKFIVNLTKHKITSRFWSQKCIKTDLAPKPWFDPLDLTYIFRIPRIVGACHMNFYAVFILKVDNKMLLLILWTCGLI